MTKVVQLEGTSDNELGQLVQDLKTDLEQLNKEKEIIIKYIQQQSEEAGVEGFADI